MRYRLWLLLFVPLLVSLLLFPPIRALTAPLPPQFGDPLPGLSADDLALFEEGQGGSEKVEEVAELLAFLNSLW